MLDLCWGPALLCNTKKLTICTFALRNFYGYSGTFSIYNTTLSTPLTLVASSRATDVFKTNAIFWSAIFVCMIDYKFYSRNFKNEITWEVTILKLYAKYFHDIFRYKEGRPN